MEIAIASGKGGTGKTTVAVNLALSFVAAGRSVALLDCDVEEPNCHLFLRPQFSDSRPVAIPKPRVDESRCNGCGVCAAVCEFHALTRIGNRVLVFSELCHGCGACLRLCPEKAMTEEAHPIGTVEEGDVRGFRLIQGRLNIGEVMTPAVIRAVRSREAPAEVRIIDAPPGTSCPVVESVRGADFVLLVTEPTPFGLNDLQLAVEMVRALGIPLAVVLNRCDGGDEQVRTWCEGQGIEIILCLPDDRRIAETYAWGELLLEKLPEYGPAFTACRQRLAALANGWGDREVPQAEERPR